MGLQPSKSSACRVRTRMAKVHTTDLKRSWKIVGKIRCPGTGSPQTTPHQKKRKLPSYPPEVRSFVKVCWCFWFFWHGFFHHHCPWSTAWLSSSDSHDQRCFRFCAPDGHPQEAWKSQGFVRQYDTMRHGHAYTGRFAKDDGELGYVRIDWDTRL